MVTDCLDDGVLDDPLLALFGAGGGKAARGVPAGTVAQLKIHTHTQMLQQGVKHLQDRWT